MAKMKRLIFKVNNLEKKYGSISALDLKKLTKFILYTAVFTGLLPLTVSKVNGPLYPIFSNAKKTLSKLTRPVPNNVFSLLLFFFN